MTIWRMLVACWLPKAINTYLEYVILTAFQCQQWLHKRPLMLHYMYIACLVITEMESVYFAVQTECLTVTQVHSSVYSVNSLFAVAQWKSCSVLPHGRKARHVTLWVRSTTTTPLPMRTDTGASCTKSQPCPELPGLETWMGMACIIPWRREMMELTTEWPSLGMQHATVCSAPWRGHGPWLFGRVGVVLLLFKLKWLAPWQQHSVTSFVLQSLLLGQVHHMSFFQLLHSIKCMEHFEKYWLMLNHTLVSLFYLTTIICHCLSGHASC